MEKPNNDWVSPALGATTAGLAALTVSEQRKARKAQEQEKAYKKRVKKIEGISSARRNFKEGIITRSEALEHCKIIGVSDAEMCIPEELCPVKAKTQQPSFQKNKPQQITNTIISNERSEDLNNYTNLSANCVDENTSYLSERHNAFVHVNAEPSSSDLETCSSSAPFINPNLAGLAAVALVLMGYSGLSWLKKKNSLIKKYFTSNEEYFLESHGLIHKKLDKILEDQEKK